MTRLIRIRTAAMLSILVLAAGAAFPQQQSLTIPKSFDEPEKGREMILPEPLEGVGFDQRLGESVPLDLVFYDHGGERVRLGDLVSERPVLLAPVYFDCPMLCSLVLDGVVRSLKPLKFRPGNEFDVVAVSFDPGETPQHAAKIRERTLERYGKQPEGAGWHFLVGDEAEVETLMSAIGFRYRYDPETDLYAHAGGIVVLTPEGRLARYFYGVDYSSKDLRLSVVEAADNEVGSLVDQVLLFCFRYDPLIGKYSAATLNLVRAGCVITLILLGAYLVINWRRERRGLTGAAGVRS